MTISNNSRENAQPRVGRPIGPKGYGIPETEENLLPWGYVQERMEAALNYWICTTRPNGRPHTNPIWGAWLDDTLYIEGSPETRWARNLAANPAISVHLESGTEAVILDGEAHEVPRPAPELAQRLSKAFSAKYAPLGYTPGPDNWDHGGLVAIHTKTALAWAHFPTDATRFAF